MNQIVTDVLGRSREAKEYPDTSYDCPFCMAWVEAGSPAHAAGKCPNPACFARGGVGMPAYPVERAREVLAEAERREEEKRQRKELDVWRRESAETRRREEEEKLSAVRVEAISRGACVSCAVESARFGRKPKFTKHRLRCPKSGR